MGTTTRQADPLGIMAFTCALIGFAISASLWTLQIGAFPLELGGFEFELFHGGELRDQVLWLAATLGAIGVGAGLLSGLGGRPRGLTGLSIVLGLLAITYPVMTFLEMISLPLS
jgi:hypothetical protein